MAEKIKESRKGNWKEIWKCSDLNVKIICWKGNWKCSDIKEVVGKEI